MDQRVHSVKGVPCLYCYTYRSGAKRYFIKTQFRGHIYTENLSVPLHASLNQLKQLTRRAVAAIKDSVHKKLQNWLEDYIVLRQLKPKTAIEYRRILGKYSFDDQANQKLFMQTISSGRNVCQTVRTVNAFFRWLIENGVKIKNPAAMAKLPKARIRTRTLSSKDIQLLYRELASESLELQLLTRLLCETGARISSILALKSTDLHPDGLHLYNIKCDRAYTHAIPLCKETKALWDKLTPQTGENLFEGKARLLQRWLRRLLDRLFNTDPTEERIVIHSLRHTAATIALQSGLSMEIVSQMLDHISINTTYQIYARSSKQQIQDAFGSLWQSYCESS